jgi:hypothetical protein
MVAGESVSACLERFPEYAAELAPLLATVAGASGLRPVPARAESVALERRAQFMASALETSRVVKKRPAGVLAALALWWNRNLSGLDGILGPGGFPRALPAGLLTVLVAVLLVGTLATGAVTASATAIPGDPLYPIKSMAERARIFLARDQLERQVLEDQIAGRRLEEIRSFVALLRRVNRMPIEGILEEMGEMRTVSGLHVLILPETVISVPEGAGVSEP